MIDNSDDTGYVQLSSIIPDLQMWLRESQDSGFSGTYADLDYADIVLTGARIYVRQLIHERDVARRRSKVGELTAAEVSPMNFTTTIRRRG